jgi:integrase/recombinase XerD
MLPRRVRFDKPGRRPGAAWGDKKPDPIAALKLTLSMEAHFEALLLAGGSAETVRGRRIALRQFIAWADQRGLTEPGEITGKILGLYQRHLFARRKPDGAPLTIGTQFGCLMALRGWFKWLAAEGAIPANPAAGLVLPRLPKLLPRALLGVAETEAILAAADPVTPEGLRDRAMLELLYSTGLRRTELAHLRRYDADLSRLVVFVREGKGRKDRWVPLGARAAAWLDRYLIEARPRLLGAASEALFVTDWGQPVTPEHAADAVRRAKARAGVDKPGATHLLRHACATHMLDNGADVRHIQALLGHASLATTERYTHVAISKLQEVHAKTHPAAGVSAEPTASRSAPKRDEAAATGGAGQGSASASWWNASGG